VTAAVERLRKRSEFLAVAAANRRWSMPGLVLQARTALSGASDQRGKLRIGFTATKKVGNAVSRNRARRRLRAALHDVLKSMDAAPADLVLVARQGTLTRPYPELKSDLRNALLRLGIVK